MENKALKDAAVGLTLKTSVDHLLVGKDAGTVDVTLDIYGAREVKNVQLSTNIGAVTAPRLDEESPGRFVATYSPADAFHPHSAILVASADLDGARYYAWGVLALWGVGSVNVAARPGTKVRVIAGAQTFGPVLADASGKAAVRLELPPGISTVTANDKKLKIPTIPQLRVHALPASDFALGDGESASKLLLFAVDRSGAPLRDPTQIYLEAVSGTIGPARMKAPGEFEADYVPPMRGTGEPVVRASIVGVEERFSKARFHLVGGAPARIELSMNPARLQAGAAEPSHLVVRVLDRAGQTTPATVELVAVGASVGRTIERELGIVTAEIRADSLLPASRQAHVTARVVNQSGAVTLTEEIVIPTEPAAPTRVFIKSDEIRQPVADGRDYPVQVIVEDLYGNGVSGLSIVPEALEGRFDSAEDLGLGRYHLRYEVPFAYEETRDTLRVRVGDQEGVAVVDLRPMPRRLTVGLMGGYTTNLASLHAPNAAIDIGWRLAGLGSDFLAGFTVVGEISAFHRYAVSRQGAYDVSAHLTAVPAGLGVRYGLAVLPWLVLEAEALGQAALINDLLFVNEWDSHQQRWLVPGATAHLGLAWHLGIGSILFHIRGFGFVNQSPTLDGALLGGSIMTGYRFDVL